MDLENEQDLFFEEDTVFVDLILPVPIPNLFTYRLSREIADQAQIGVRAIVYFGKNRILTGVIANIHNTPPKEYKAKYVLEILDDSPIVTQDQLWLFQWIADYYCTQIGTVLKVALPSGLKVSSESKIEINPDFENPELLDQEEKVFFDYLAKKGVLPMDETILYFGKEQVNKALKKLVGKRAIIIFEDTKEQYRPKIEKYVRLKAPFNNQDAVMDLLDTLPQKQQEIVLFYLQKISFENLNSKNEQGLPISLINKNDFSKSSLKTLIKNGIFEEFEIKVSRFPDSYNDENKTIQLSKIQQETSNKIFQLFEEKSTVLFHGITGSGKTEIYIDLINQVLASGSQVLLMLPEIALTTQIVSRLKKVFGNKMGVYHSKFSDNERVEVYRGILENKFNFIVGVRSSIFLPFSNLGLIIVDEEHETSYKQFEPAPRYNAKTVAIMLSKRMGAKVLLGSATPSIESYKLAKDNVYGLVELNKRYGDAELPEFEFANVKTERKNKTIKGEFTSVLLNGITETLAKNEQAIIFQNRRGYSPYLVCQECDWTAQCHQCSVSLTYHMKNHELICHYCGYKQQEPKNCPACGKESLIPVGIGTEKIEDELKSFFPNANIQRMDYDTTRKKNDYSNIINQFAAGQIDILVGTQMLSKGLDFDKVSLVGIFDADRMLHFPDFRANERTMQMITQVSGRAGRRQKKGKVIIQTAQPNNRVLQQIVNYDYKGFYEHEIIEREEFNYPPFSRIIKVTTKHKDPKIAFRAADHLANKMQKLISKKRVLGPEKAIIERVRNQYIYDIYLKLEKSIFNIQAIKLQLSEEITNLLYEKEFKSVRFIINVDPQ